MHLEHLRHSILYLDTSNQRSQNLDSDRKIARFYDLTPHLRSRSHLGMRWPQIVGGSPRKLVESVGSAVFTIRPFPPVVDGNTAYWSSTQPIFYPYPNADEVPWCFLCAAPFSAPLSILNSLSLSNSLLITLSPLLCSKKFELYSLLNTQSVCLSLSHSCKRKAAPGCWLLVIRSPSAALYAVAPLVADSFSGHCWSVKWGEQWAYC